MLNRILVLNIIIALVLVFAGCSKKVIKPESVLDTPQNHYNQGMRMLEKGDLRGAWDEFDRANKMNPHYPDAYAGKALVRAEEGKFKEAYRLIDDGLDEDNKNRSLLIAKGRIITMEHKGKKWLENAVKTFEKALKYHNRDSEALYFLGEAYKNGYEFSKAADAFSKVIENKDDWSAKANSEWELVQKIVRAAPGTRIGKKIALIDEIDRADLAVLFMEELKLPQLLEKKREKQYDTSFKTPEDPMKYTEKSAPPKTEGPKDISQHWAKNWIKEIVKLGGMEMYPDHAFHPDKLVTRAEFALLIQNILITITGDPGLGTKYFGEESHFTDVNSSHPAYNAIVLCVNRGILKTRVDGSFGLTDHISGADALLAIRDFQNSLRMIF